MDFLLAADPKKMYQVSLRHPRCTDFERENIKNLQVFQNLCKAVHRKRARDAFHLWAAECSNLDYFLTSDTTFLNVYRTAVKDKKVNFKCRPVSPDELANELNISTDDIQIPEHAVRCDKNAPRNAAIWHQGKILLAPPESQDFYQIQRGLSV